MPSGGRRLRPLAVRGNVAVAAAVVVSAALCCLRPAGLAAAVSNSPAEVPVLAGSVLIGYALGYQAGLVAGAAGCVALITALEVSAPVSGRRWPATAAGPPARVRECCVSNW
jgi:hypothetical protein